MLFRTIMHSTGDYAIEESSKDELIDALMSAGGLKEGETAAALKRQPKSILVALAKAKRDELKAVHDEAAANVEAARQAQLNAEKADPKTHAILDSLSRGFSEHYDDAVKTLIDFRSAVAAAEPHNVVYHIGRFAETVMYADGIIREMHAVTTYLQDQAKEQDQTLDEIAKGMDHDRERLTRDCINDDGFRHNSTCPVRNMENIGRHKAKQFTARILTDACKKLADARQPDGEPDRCATIFDRRW